MTALDPAVAAYLRRHYEGTGKNYAADPMSWVADRLPGTHLWSKQREIVEALAEHPNVAVYSGHGIGKSFVASLIVMWWLDSWPAGTAFVLTSAPTAAQVRAVLWREINRRFDEGHFSGRCTQTELHDVNDELVAIGRKGSDYTTSAMVGYHAEHMLVLLDEAGGVAPLVWEAAETLTSSEGSKTLAIGNPDESGTDFHRACVSDSWHSIKISVLDSPLFTGEPVPDKLKRVLTSPRWVEERKARWGETSPIYQARVLAEFPSDAADGVIPASWLARARMTELVPSGPVEAGLDVAAGGNDRAVLWVRQGPVAIARRTLAGESDPLKLSQWVEDAVVEFGVEQIKVDSIGVGWAVCGLIRQSGLPVQVIPVSVAERADDPEQYLNLRSQLWWDFRELCRLKAIDLRAIDDDDAVELTAVRYDRNNPRTRIQIEAKEALRKRLGRSPDLADSLLLAFRSELWIPDVENVKPAVQRRLPLDSYRRD